MEEGSENTLGAWRGELRLGDCWAAWQGEIGDGALHRHFAAQAVIASRPVRVLDEQDRWIEADCVLIEPLAFHRIEAGREAQLIYLEPGKRVAPEAEALLAPVRTASSLAVVSSSQGASRFWARWLSSSSEAPNSLDTRMESTLEYIERKLLAGPVPLQHAATHAALSQGRFRHLFTEQIGVPYRRYVLWRRLRLATAEMMRGSSVTTAAHAAGFADAAHFARTLKTTFGVTASQALVRQ